MLNKKYYIYAGIALVVLILVGYGINYFNGRLSAIQNNEIVLYQGENSLYLFASSTSQVIESNQGYIYNAIESKH